MNQKTIYSWYEQHKTGIFRFSLSILKDAQLAEDVLQEVFVKLLSSGMIPDPGKERAWLYKTARNHCYDILRKRKRETDDIPVMTAPSDQNWEFIELISPLSETEQQIVSLKFIGGFSHKEIARIMGLTVHGIKKRYERAIGKLRKEMEKCI